MIYLDALDGADLLAGEEYAWYYAAKFVFELVKRLDRPAILEMSIMYHNLWYLRSRMGAWDHATRGYKRLIDAHNRNNRRMEEECLLPHTLGWYHFGSISAETCCIEERGFSDDYEYLCKTALISGDSLAFTDFSPSMFETVDEARRNAEIIRRYERLRLSGKFPKESAPSGECILCGDALVSVEYRSIVLEEGQHTILLDNRELMLLRAENRPIADVSREEIEVLTAEQIPGMLVFSSLNVKTEVTEDDDPMTGRCMRMRLERKSGRCGYGRAELRYPTPKDLKGRPALTFMLKGDGKGELLNVQLRSPRHTNSGTFDRTVLIDFSGWKRIVLTETNAATLYDYEWPFSGGGHYVKPEVDPLFDISPARDAETEAEIDWYDSMKNAGIYQILREKVDFSQIESLSFWVNGMKPGESYDLCVADVKACPILLPVCKELTIMGDGIRIMSAGLPPLSYAEWRNGALFAFDGEGKAIPTSAPVLPMAAALSSVTAEVPKGCRIKLTYGLKR